MLATVQVPVYLYELMLPPDADVLERCDAIIMGARGMGALHSALLGSVSQRVMHGAALPVTIVKHHRADAPGQSAGG